MGCRWKIFQDLKKNIKWGKKMLTPPDRSRTSRRCNSESLIINYNYSITESNQSLMKKWKKNRHQSLIKKKVNFILTPLIVAEHVIAVIIPRGFRESVNQAPIIPTGISDFFREKKSLKKKIKFCPIRS